MNFFEKLTNTIRQNNSLLCVGLDPEPSMILSELPAFNKLVIEATADIACAYKPNLAIYEAMGCEGLAALKETLQIIRQTDPDIPIIGDGKRADIGPCSIAYTRMLFDQYNFDAVTVSPYMGTDSLEPFLARRDKGVFILCHTSNSGAVDIQELMVIDKDDSTARPLYETVAELARKKWNGNGNVGLVVGATYPQEISRIRRICPDMLFLIPGVGFQGGTVASTVQAAVDARGGGFIINVSRQIMYAAKTPRGTQSKPAEAIRKMRHTACHIRNEINRHIANSVASTSEENIKVDLGKSLLYQGQ